MFLRICPGYALKTSLRTAPTNLGRIRDLLDCIGLWDFPIDAHCQRRMSHANAKFVRFGPHLTVFAPQGCRPAWLHHDLKGMFSKMDTWSTPAMQALPRRTVSACAPGLVVTNTVHRRHRKCWS